MKLLVLFIFSTICYINVQSVTVLELASAIASKAVLKCRASVHSNLDVSKVVVYFYDFQHHFHKSFPIDEAAQEILSISKLKKRNKFFIYVGGFKSHIAKKSTEEIKHAFKDIRNSYLIIVDHSAYTHDLDGYKTSYERSVRYVPHIGNKLAEVLVAFRKGGISPKFIRCIGHSLGGQILGYVGENFKKLTGRKIARITALDPAGPCFVGNSKNVHIRSGVADYVEIYHCNAGVLGSDQSLGDVNFFADDGKTQSVCKKSSFLSVSKSWSASKCSHNTCVAMWTASVLHRDWFPAYECDKYKNFKHGKCSHHAQTSAGFWNRGRPTGTYYFSTKDYDFN